MALSTLAASAAGATTSDNRDVVSSDIQGPAVAFARPTVEVEVDQESVPKPTERREVHAAGHEWEWQLRGACRDVSETEAELFFHPWGERDPSRGRRDRDAKAICARCPVMAQCRDYALATREPYGVWGGLSEHEREDILGVRFG